MRASSALPLVLSVLLAVTDGYAQESTAAAEALFRDGRGLMARGRFAEACEKFAESQRLDPAAGTLLNLGECSQRQGKVFSAWRAFRDAASLAESAGQRERARGAAARADAIAPRIPTLTVSPPARIAELEVHHDGEALARSRWEQPQQLDPGVHVLEATAPGLRPWRLEIEVSEGEHRTVAIPELEVEPIAPQVGPPAPLRATPPTGDVRTQAVAGWAVAGVGAASVVTGVVFGLVANARNDEARQQWCSNVDCEPRGVQLIEEAKSAALVSTFMVIGGAAAIAGGLGLALTAPRSTPRSSAGARLLVLPGGVAASGTF